MRTVYNIIDALTSTGGFASIIMFIFKLFTLRIQRALFRISVMKKMFICLNNDTHSKLIKQGKFKEKELRDIDYVPQDVEAILGLNKKFSNNSSNGPGSGNRDNMLKQSDR